MNNPSFGLCKGLYVAPLLAALLLQSGQRVAAAGFAKGADVSWLTEMEAGHVDFYDKAGVRSDLLTLLKGDDMNAIRLRVWVHPAGGWCGKEDVVKKAVRAQKQGFRIMIDFHYSDTWADPGHQTKPAAWQNHDIARLKSDVTDHTRDVLSALKAAGVTPEWVQIGNETNDGMLWPEGKASGNMKNFAELIASGHDAVKSVFPGAKVVVHLSNGFKNETFRWMFDGLTANGAKFDVIGLSLYPSTAADPTGSKWPKFTAQCLANMNDMVARYHKDVCICEVGMDRGQAQATREMLVDLMKEVRSVPDGRGLGVFYWEPEAYQWHGYSMSAWETTGRPSAAMDAFRDDAPGSGAPPPPTH